MDSGAIGEGALVGQAIERLEDAALLTGAGRYMDDLPLAPGTLHAAILRSSHAHAELVAIDATAALALPGVAAVVTREEVRRWTRPFTGRRQAADGALVPCRRPRALCRRARRGGAGR